jgi:hypothetical protein
MMEGGRCLLVDDTLGVLYFGLCAASLSIQLCGSTRT